MHSIGRDLGDFFEVTVIDLAELAPPWQRIDELIHRPERLRARVDAVRRALPGADARVAASVAQLGLVARLIATDLGVAVTKDASLDLERAWWQDRLGGPFPLAASVVARRSGLSPVVADLTAAVEDLGVSSQVLWGNVASAINSAARLIAAGRPDLAGRAAVVADDWLAEPRVEGGGLRSGPDFRRHSCCLIYQVAGDRRAVCGDCVLRAPAPGRRRRDGPPRRPRRNAG